MSVGTGAAGEDGEGIGTQAAFARGGAVVRTLITDVEICTGCRTTGGRGIG